MGILDKLKGKKEEPAPQARQEPVDGGQEQKFYEESGGVTRVRAIELLQEIRLMPEQPLGVAGGEDHYGVVSLAGYVVIFFNGDKAHKMKVDKREFMTVKTIGRRGISSRPETCF